MEFEGGSEGRGWIGETGVGQGLELVVVNCGEYVAGVCVLCADRVVA